MPRPSISTMSVLIGLISLSVTSAAGAQEARDRRHHAQVRQQTVAAVTPSAPTGYRGLTITRPPNANPDAYEEQDIYRDGPVRYNDIRDFSPSPYTTSGVQYPFGLDGIGGYGSDLDYGSGQDSALYNRGAGSGP